MNCGKYFRVLHTTVVYKFTAVFLLLASCKTLIEGRFSTRVRSYLKINQSLNSICVRMRNVMIIFSYNGDLVISGRLGSAEKTNFDLYFFWQK